MIRLVLAAAALLSMPAAAHAAKAVKPGAVRLDPALGYVLVRAGPVIGKKHKASPLFFWRYDAARQAIRTTAKKDPARIAKGEDAGFNIGTVPLELTGANESAFLMAVTPGEYVFHGTATTCFCLGSVAFTVRPGVVTDVGTVHQASPAAAEGFAEFAGVRASPDLVERGYVLADIASVTPADASARMPAALAGLAVEPAVLRPDQRFVNVAGTRAGYAGGILVNRLHGLPPVVNADGSSMVARHRADNPDRPIGPQPAASDTPQPAKR